jgi:Fis family transcriptional regulator
MRIDAMEQFVGLDAAEAERYLILATLKHTGGNRTHAANILGISIRTIRNKLHAYAQTDDDVHLPSDEH